MVGLKAQAFSPTVRWQERSKLIAPEQTSEETLALRRRFGLLRIYVVRGRRLARGLTSIVYGFGCDILLASRPLRDGGLGRFKRFALLLGCCQFL